MEPFHFARRIVERPHGDAADACFIVVGEKIPASRWREIARQVGKLGLEVLEAEIDAQAPGIFSEDGLDRIQLLRELGGVIWIMGVR
jgi:hypothetical protein